jgi:nucleoside-diphosphate-sugar epimerase
MSPRVLITGSTGFIGSAVLPLLADHASAIAAVVRPGQSLKSEKLARIDAAGPELVDAIADFNPDVVIHLATHFLANHEITDIPALIRSNVEFGTFVLEGAAQSSARVLNVNSAWQHVDGAPYSPVSLYAATKQAFSDIASYYSQVRELEVRDVTLFDSYGPSDTRMKLVPLLLAAARSGASLDMSDGQQLIDLTFVDDVATGIMRAALAIDVPESAVIRSWKPMTVREVVDRVEAVTGKPVNVNWGVRPTRPREMRSDWIFGTALPGWLPKVSIDEGFDLCWSAALSVSPSSQATSSAPVESGKS